MRTRISEIDIEVGKRLREARTRAGLTLQELGRQVGLSGWQVSKYEHAIDRMPVSRLIAIAKALGIKPAELLPE